MSEQPASGGEREIVAVDLFCGAGGFSEGLRQACDELGYFLSEAAINHWEPAIQTHEANHPTAHQYHSKVEQLHPPDVIQRLSDDDTTPNVDLLVGGPECTHFSRARGGKPVNEQKRMSPWHVLDWLEKLNVDAFVIENVPEIQDWGPVEDGQPVRDGSIFDAWVNALNQLGYAVDWTQLIAADYGDPTTRERFFIIGRQAGSVTFPAPTHSNDCNDLPDHRTAAEIIDWSDLGGSIWTRDLDDGRKTPPKNSTMQRIAEGLRRHCSDAIEPFADVLETLGKDDIYRLREERVVPSEYAATVADLVNEPFLVPLPDQAAAMSATHLLRQQDGAHPLNVDHSPVPTIATRGAHAIVTTETRSLVMPRNGPRGDLHSNTLYPPEARPLHTVTASNHDGHLLTPSLVRYSHGSAALDVTDPISTIATKTGDVFAPSSTVLRPFIDDYEGPPKPLNNPLGTITSRDRFGLCIPELWPWGLDVRYRMLQPRELKQAQGFPADYELAGTKTDRTAQIGNAVPVNLAKSLCKHVLTAEDPSLATFGGGLSTEPDAEVPSYEEVASDD